MRHDRRCFGRLEQEDQRLKKHYGRWMDIVRSLELESFILTKLTKHSVPVNLVGPQVSLPPRWVPTSRGVFIILRVIRRHFLVCTPTVSLFRCLLFVDHVVLTAPRAQTWWTRARPRKRTTRSW